MLIFPCSCSVVAAFEIRILEIFCKTNSNQSVGIHNNNLEDKGLNVRIFSQVFVQIFPTFSPHSLVQVYNHITRINSKERSRYID